MSHQPGHLIQDKEEPVSPWKVLAVALVIAVVGFLITNAQVDVARTSAGWGHSPNHVATSH